MEFQVEDGMRMVKSLTNKMRQAMGQGRWYRPTEDLTGSGRHDQQFPWQPTCFSDVQEDIELNSSNCEYVYGTPSFDSQALHDEDMVKLVGVSEVTHYATSNAPAKNVIQRFLNIFQRPFEENLRVADEELRVHARSNLLDALDLTTCNGYKRSVPIINALPKTLNSAGPLTDKTHSHAYTNSVKEREDCGHIQTAHLPIDENMSETSIQIQADEIQSQINNAKGRADCDHIQSQPRETLSNKTSFESWLESIRSLNDNNIPFLKHTIESNTSKTTTDVDNEFEKTTTDVDNEFESDIAFLSNCENKMSTPKKSIIGSPYGIRATSLVDGTASLPRVPIHRLIETAAKASLILDSPEITKDKPPEPTTFETIPRNSDSIGHNYGNDAFLVGSSGHASPWLKKYLKRTMRNLAEPTTSELQSSAIEYNGASGNLLVSRPSTNVRRSLMFGSLPLRNVTGLKPEHNQRTFWDVGMNPDTNLPFRDEADEAVYYLMTKYLDNKLMKW